MSFKMSITLAALVGAVLGLGILGLAPAADALEIVKPTDYEKIADCGQSTWCPINYDVILKTKIIPVPFQVVKPNNLAGEIELKYPGEDKWATAGPLYVGDTWDFMQNAGVGEKIYELTGNWYPGVYRMKVQAKYGSEWEPWSPWRHFCIAPAPECQGGGKSWKFEEAHKELIPIPIPGPPPYAERLRRDAERLTPHQQSPEAQLLLRDIQALQRELAAGADPKEADRLRRDADRLGREVDRLEARLLREQQRAAAGAPAPSAPAKPEAPAPGSQPGQPAGPPQVAAVPRPAPARDPVAEQAAKELESLAKRLNALGTNPEAQRLLREVQLLQRQLGSEPGQAPAILKEAQRLDREVDRLEASLRQPATPAPRRAR